MTTTTQINITAKDSTAAAFSSANNNLASLASSALKTTAGLAGIGLSIAGAVDAIKGISQATIQLQQFTNTLQVGTGSAKGAADALAFVRKEAQRLGLDLASSAEQFAKLSAASQGTALAGKATRDIFTSVSQAATVLGLSADQASGALLAIQQMISKGTVSAEELRGQLGERLPGAFQLAARAIGVTTSELDKLLRTGSVTAEQLLPALSKELDKTFGSQSEQAAQGLNAQMNRMNTAIFDLKIAIGESGLINFLSSGIELATKLAGALTSAFGGGQKLSPIEQQVSLIKTLEEELESLQNLTNIPLIGDLLFDKKQADLLKFRIESATEDLGKMKASLAAESGGETVISTATKQAETLSAVTKKTISDAERFITALRKEAETAGLTAFEMKRLEASKLGVSAAANPLISRIEKVTSEMDQQKESARALADDMRKIASITESVRTGEEKLIETQTELERLMKSGLGIETYNRALKKAQDETKGVTTTTKNTTDQVDQLWTQAGRNIQSSLANSIFNFFDDGLKGMVKNVGIAVARIASEFAALRIAQSIGLAGIFGGASGAALASGGGGGSALGGALSLGSNVLSLAGGGFGSVGAIGSGLSAFGGSIGAFGSGLAGTGAGVFSAAGGAGTAFIGGAGTAVGGSGMGVAAGMGASMASAATIALPLIAADLVGRLLAGNRKLGGAEYIPVIGGFLAAMFGREPYKFRQQSLQGTVSSEGFDGDIANVFRSKGGLFSSNKHKTVIEELSKDQQTAFDTAIGSFYDSARGFAENLGLSADLVDNYTTEIQIKSKKGGKITEEAITEMLAGIGNGLAENILPIVSTLKNAGEEAFATLSRLNTEFNTLVGVAQILGNSVKDSRERIQGVTFESREAFLQMAGGIESLSQQTAFFAENFLTDAEKLAPIQESLANALGELNLSSITTKEEFKSLVQSFGKVGGISAETFTALLKLSDQFLIVANAADQARIAEEARIAVLEQARIAEEEAIKADQIRNATADSNDRKRNDAADVNRDQSKMRAYLEKLKDGYQAQLVQGVDKIDGALKSITESVSKLASLTGIISSASDSIKPQSLKSAQAILAAAAVRAKRGDFVNDSDIAGSLSTVQSIDGGGFASALDLARQQATALESMSQIAVSAAGESSALSSKIPGLEQEKSDLITKMSEFIGRVDELIGDIGRAIRMGMTGSNSSLAYINWGDAMGSHQNNTTFGGGAAPKGYNFGQSPRKETSEDVLNKILAATESNANATNAMANKIKRWDGDGMPDVRTL